MKNYYQDIVTAKSWQQLIKLRAEVDFILIGGWAIYLYTRALKSKDIDIIVDYNSLAQLKKNYGINKNERLKKYELKKEGIDVDIYLPHYSNLGLGVEKLQQFTTRLEAFKLLQKEVLLVTKIYAYSQRKLSVKGYKDKIDIISLLFLEDFNFCFFLDFIKKHGLQHCAGLLEELLLETTAVPELNLNRHFFSRKKKDVFKQLFS